MTAESGRTPLLPTLIGFGLAGALILLLGFWTAIRRASPEPTLILISPRQDTTVPGTLKVLFESNLTLRLQSTGWGSGRYHVHALLDSTELMPAAADIRSLGSNRYEWVLPAPRRPQRLQLIWALPNHARLGTGNSASIRIEPVARGPAPDVTAK